MSMKTAITDWLAAPIFKLLSTSTATILHSFAVSAVVLSETERFDWRAVATRKKRNTVNARQTVLSPSQHSNHLDIRV